MSGDLVLALLRFELEFIVNTDASDYGYGAFLEQEIDGRNRIIS